MQKFITSFAEQKIVTAAAADKIRAFGIKDPSLMLMITKFESLIPWNQITDKSETGVMNAIQPLVSNLYKKAGFEQGFAPEAIPSYTSADSNYLKDVNILTLISDNRKGREGKINTNAGPEIIEATSKILENNETVPRNPQGLVDWKDENSEAIISAVKNSKRLEVGRNYLLNYYNAIKENVFAEWIENTSDLSPAKQFLILKPVFDSSPATSRDMPTPFNKNAFTQLTASIDAIADLQHANDFSVSNIYKEASKIKIDIQKQEGMRNWLRIPSLKHDSPDQFEKNYNMLHTIAKNSSDSWCIGGSKAIAKTYLSQGDFWLYMKDGKATVCIRQADKEILEIRDPTQMQFCMAEAGDIVWLVEDSPFAKFFNPKSTAYTGNADPQKVGGNVGANITRDHNYAAIGYINKSVNTEQGQVDVRAKLMTDPFFYNWLLPENRAAFKDDAIRGFAQILKTQSRRYAEVPTEFTAVPHLSEAIIEGVPQLISSNDKYADIINDLPTKFKFLKTNQAFWTAVAAGLATRFAVNPPTDEEFGKIDTVVNKFPKVLYNLSQGVVNAITKTPSTFFKLPQTWLSRPQFYETALKAFIPVAPKYIQENPEKNIFEKMPEQLQNDPAIKQSLINGVPTFLKRRQEPFAISLVPDFAIQDPTVIAFIKAWAPQYVVSNIRNIQYIPEQLRNDPEFIGPVTQGAIEHVKKNPEDLEIMAQYVPDKNALLQAYLEGAKAKIMTDRTFEIPNSVLDQLQPQQRQEIQQTKFTKNVKEIVENPRLLIQYPDILRNPIALNAVANEVAQKILSGNMEYDAKLHPALLQHKAVKEAFLTISKQKGRKIIGPKPVKPQRPQLPPAPAQPQLPPPAIPGMPPQIDQNELPNPQLPPDIQASTWYKKLKFAKRDKK